MSPSQNEPEPAGRYRDTSASDIADLGDQVVALIEEFEAALSEGRIPPAFAERLAQLQQTAERLLTDN